MLDDLKYIHSRDAADALGVAEKQSQQLTQSFDLPAIEGQFTNVVLSGMGGSALAGLLSKTWPGLKVPFEIVRKYDIPAYVGPQTLFIASSYSGNTEETVSALEQAEKAHAKIAIITSGGILAEKAELSHYPVAKLSSGFQPRMAVFAGFKALMAIWQAAGLIGPEIDAELAKTSAFMSESVKSWLPTVPKASNPAKSLAEELAGKSMVVYGGPLMFPAAYKWKISFNESSKNVAWCNEYSEFNHNEFMGWSSHPIEKPYGIVDLRSNLEDDRINHRFELSNKLLSGKRPAPITVQAEGETVLEQLLWLVNFGDFVSLYLALLNGIDPSPVDLIEKLKLELR